MHSNYDISNFYIFNLTEPEFESNKFMSKFVDENNSPAYIKSGSLRLLDITGNILTVEFLYSSQEFYDFIKSIDNYLKEQLIEKGPIWFGDKFDTDKINNLYRSSVHLPTKLPGLPIIKFKLDENCILVGKDDNRYDIDDLKTNMEIKVHFCIEGVEFHKNQCNASFTCYQVNVMRNFCQTIDNFYYPNSEIMSDTEDEILDLANTSSEE